MGDDRVGVRTARRPPSCRPLSRELSPGLTSLDGLEATRTALDELGPLFAVDIHDDDAAPPAPWRPIQEVLTPDVVGTRVAEVRERLAQAAGRPVDLTIAASLTQLGLASRVLAPALAVASWAGRVLSPDLRGVWWRPEIQNTFGLSVPVSAVSGEVDGEKLAEDFRRLSVGPFMASLVAVMREVADVPPTVLWGNVASGLQSAATVVSAGCAGAPTHPDVLVRAALEAPEFVGAATYAGGVVARKTCCLLSRITDGPSRAVCGDCPLD